MAATLSSGCSPSRGDAFIELTFDPCAVTIWTDATDADELSSIDQGIGMWNTMAGLRLARSSGTERHGLGIRYGEALHSFRGVYDDQEGIAFVNRRLDRRARAIAVAHEVGHAFGLLHVERAERLSVMNPGNVVVAPTFEDGNALWELWDACAFDAAPGG